MFKWDKDYKIISGTGGSVFLQDGKAYVATKEGHVEVGKVSEISPEDTPDVILSKAKGAVEKEEKKEPAKKKKNPF